MKALVLSGGGAKGAFQVGAIQHIIGHLEKQYDIYCGVSVGALNAAFLAMFSNGQEKLAAKSLTDIWNTIDDSKIFKQRYPIGKSLSTLLSALSSKSLYDSTPLINLILDKLVLELVRTSGKILRVGAVSLNTGEYKEWGETDKDIALAVAASSAYPGFFNPIKIEEDYWTDGGVKQVIPLRAAIALGAKEIDIIKLTPEKTTDRIDVEHMNVAGGAPVLLDIMSDEISANNIRLAQLMAPQDVKIRVLQPSRVLLRNSLNFSQKKIQENIAQGFYEAQRILW